MVRTLGEVRPSPPNSRIVASSEPKDLQGGDCEGVDGGRNGEGSGTFFPETLGDAIKGGVMYSTIFCVQAGV